ncbi:MAG: efflux RND transporter periplasmic adaptor subunit [Chloroflexi bacterium]|nr:efflux RND transporter periplasmic adaptor subunit [Chloroflexota bacterium]
MKNLKLLVVLLAGLLLAACDSGAATPTAAPLPPQKAASDVVAEAEVVPVKYAELNLSAQGQLVSEVMVAEGDAVKKDQILLRIDSKRQTAAVAQAEAGLAKARSAKLTAAAALTRAQANLALMKAGPRSEDVAVVEAGLKAAMAELDRAQAGADTTSLATARANMEKAARAVQQAQFAYDRVKDTPYGNIGPDALRLEQATLDYQVAKIAYEQLQLGPRSVDVGPARARVAQAQAQLEQVKTGTRPEQIAIGEADVAAADAQLKSVDADIAVAESSVASAKIALADTELRSPIDGTIVTLNAKAGEPAPVSSFAVRVADLSVYQIQTKDLTELSIGKIKVGNSVQIKFDAIPDAAMTGKVTRINPFGTNRQGDIVYKVIVAPEKQDARMQWNMTASVTIKTQ